MSSSSSTAVVGVVGLGRMGSCFAENLVSGGFQVIGYDQDRERAARIDGVKAAAQLADLASCDVVITSLPNDDALRSFALSADGLITTLAPGAIHISTSTVSPGLSRSLADAHIAHKQQFVAAPVLGNPDLAKAQKIFLLLSGKPEAIEHARSILDRLGQHIFVIGEDAGAAPMMKLAANVMTAATMQCMGEVLALVHKAGIDEHLAFNVFTNSLFDGRVHKAYGGKIVEERYTPPEMTIPFAVKDLRLALAEAETLGVPMPVGSVVHDRLVAMIGHGWAGLDWSGLGLLEAHDAGLESKAIPTEKSTEPHL